jgi:hypothetical protein
VSATIPTIEPSLITAGDTLKWVKTLADYSAADGWVLSYVFINAAAKFSITATASGSDFAVTVAAATTAAYAAGAYDWRAQVSKSGEVYTVSTGRATVKPAFSVATLDGRSQARTSLEAIEAMLQGRASSAVHEYEIAGRRLKYIPVPELLQLRDALRADVAREDTAARIASGLGDNRRIYVRFGP